MRLPRKAGTFIIHYCREFVRDIGLIFALVGICRIILLLVPVWLGLIVDGLIRQQTTGQGLWDAIGWPFIAIVLIGFPLRGLLYRWMMTIKLHYEGRLVTRLRSDLFDYVQQHDLAYFHSQQAGALALKIQAVTEALRNFIIMIALDVFRPVLSFIVALIILFGLYPLLGWVLIVWLVVFVSLSMVLAFRIHQFSKNDAEAKSIVGGYLTDVFGNIASVIAFARNGQETSYAHAVFDKARQAQIVKDKRGMLVDYTQETGAVILAVGLMFGLLYGFSKGQTTAGSFAIVIPLAINVAESTRALVTRMVNIFEGYGTIQNGIDTLLAPHDIVSAADASYLHVTAGEVCFEKAGFRYPNGKIVFDNLNFYIKGGEKIGLVGPSGAGKSTLLSLIMRFHDVQQGRILIDGQELLRVKLDSLRQNIALIPQDTQLFHRSIIDNIRYGRHDASIEEVEDAARQAYAHDFILALQNGYDTVVGERGAHLSGGQRQRVAIARAILKNAPILILDEATSALDSESEDVVQKALDVLMAGRTVIAVAHRLSTVQRMDRLLVLQDGKLVEEGTHDSLLAQRGAYARLWQMQAAV